MCSLSLMWCCVPQIRLEASVKLQRWWRRQAAEAAGRKAQRMLKETVRRMAQAKLRIAATNFQRLWRGVKGREQYQWIKVNHHASKIQVSCPVPRACVVWLGARFFGQHQRTLHRHCGEGASCGT